MSIMIVNHKCNINNYCTIIYLQHQLTDNMKINLIQSRLDGTNVQQQVERLKVELNQLEQERHAVSN